MLYITLNGGSALANSSTELILSQVGSHEFLAAEPPAEGGRCFRATTSAFRSRYKRFIGTQQKSEERLESKGLLGVLLAVFAAGAALRIWYYAADFSLFFDECALAINLQHRSYAALSQRLDYDQAAPLGFLCILKALTGWLGFSEHALRLVPLICGLVAVALFYMLTRQIFSGWALVAVNLLMCFNQIAISYCAQAKQYSLELMIAVIMLLLSRPLFDPNCRPKVFWINSVALGLLPWFSFTAVFVLAGICLALVLGQIWNPREGGFRRTAEALLLYGVLFTPIYFFSIRPGMGNSALRAMWIPDYFPLHALSKAPLWMIRKAYEVCALTFSKGLWSLAAAIGIVCGLAASILRRNLLMLAATGGALACFGATVLQMYPFTGRFLLFLMPTFILLLTAGYQWLITLLPRNVRIGSDVIAAGALLWCSVSAVKAYVVPPPLLDEPLKAFQFVRMNWQTGDRVYATRLASPCLIYYGSRPGFPSWHPELNVGAVDGAEHVPSTLSVPVLPGRDWLIVSRTDWLKRGESIPVIEYFDGRGTPLARIDEELTTAMLYRVR